MCGGGGGGKGLIDVFLSCRLEERQQFKVLNAAGMFEKLITAN